MSKIILKQLKKIIQEEIKITKSYQKKEDIRQSLQNIIAIQVASRKIKNEKDLIEIFDDMNMALNTLKMIPLDVWKKLKTK